MADGRIPHVGIMNASQLPLQVAAYKENIPNRSELDRCLGYVRRKKRFIAERDKAAALELAIVNDLQRRLDRIPAENVLDLVCCGKIAQGILRNIKVPDTIRITFAPHPSYGWWTKPATRAQMRRVYRIFA